MLSIVYVAGSTTSTIMIAEAASPADQTAAIQSALDAVQAAGGGSVTLSAGTFDVVGTGDASDGALRIGSNTLLQGAGMGVTVLRLADGSGSVTGIIRTDTGAKLADGSIQTTSNATIANLTIDGNRANTTGSTDGFYSGTEPGSGAADRNIVLDRVEVQNVSRYGFDPHEGTIGLTITNSVAHGNGVDGFTIDGSTNVLLANNSAYDNGRHGFNIVTGSQDVTLANNTAYFNGGSGVVVQTGNNEIRAWTSDVTITGGSLHDNGRAGIEVRQATDVTITGVDIQGNGMQGISLAGVERVAITGNTIAGNGSSPEIKVAGYLQTFGDADPVNDRYIATHAVTVNGVTVVDPLVPTGVTLYDYVVTDDADVVQGSAGRDSIDGGMGTDTLFGNGGDDTLYGNTAADWLDGGAGNDTLYGGSGNDVLMHTDGLDTYYGGTGTDTLDFTGFAAAVRVVMATGSFNAWTAGTDIATAATSTTLVARGEGVETMVGSAFSDSILGNGSGNTLKGGAGNDTIDGGAGKDTLWGGDGDDVLTGGSGNDQLVFGAGWGRDVVTDFVRGKDKIVFDGAGAPDAYADLAIASLGGNAVISFGADSITLVGVRSTQLSAADFVFW